eukprot:Skav225487  [mRNA]  locus=scaffold868:51746:58327:- [translate_table: standard]
MGDLHEKLKILNHNLFSWFQKELLILVAQLQVCVASADLVLEDEPSVLMGHCLCVHAEQADQHQQDVEPFPGRQGQWANTDPALWHNSSFTIGATEGPPLQIVIQDRGQTFEQFDVLLLLVAAAV